MTHSSSNPKRFISGLLVLAGFLLFFAASFVMLKIAGGRPTFEEKRAAERYEKLKNRTAREAELLGTYGWVNEAEGVARIPIDRAVELTIADLAKKEIRVAVAAVPQAALAAVPQAAAAAAAPQALAPQAGESAPQGAAVTSNGTSAPNGQ